MAQGDILAGHFRGNWRMEWVGRTFTLTQNLLYPALLPLLLKTRLRAVN
jgi:hypothetical protein